MYYMIENGDDFFEEAENEPSDLDEEDRSEFADPGGKSALRAGIRQFPCPTCHWPNRLTNKDVQLGYQCDSCADVAEGVGEIDYYEDHYK